MKHFQKSLFSCQLAAHCYLHLTPLLCLTTHKNLYSSSAHINFSSHYVILLKQEHSSEAAALQEERKKRRDADG